MANKDQAYKDIAKLVEDFEQRGVAARASLSEQDICNVYILPLFEALGWNYRSLDQVRAEVRVARKYADYAFSLDGITRFYVEAKKTDVKLDADENVTQAISYAYNKGVSWAILTNFESLRLYNADRELDENKDWTILSLSYHDYLDALDDLLALSPSSVRNNGIEKRFSRYAQFPKRVSVDQRLFGLMKDWRLKLINLFISYQPPDTPLRLGEIDEAVQRILDRLIFIRTIEDRQIEDKILWPIYTQRADPRKTNGKKTMWDLLKEEFRRLDDDYNSELFAIHGADSLRGDDSAFQKIIPQLYHPDGPAYQFNFSAIESDVLGRVYEQYLGHVIETSKSPVKVKGKVYLPGFQPATAEAFQVVAKQAKRKSQGIYYTPKYIVNYIVEQTLGRLLDERGKDPEFVKQIAVLDPACGSGSFLIAAYNRLLRFYAELRQLDGPEALGQQERVDILQTHIFGVDLDPQAVEIARLNLLLRALKEPNKRLPKLDSNIVQGNSLIGEIDTQEHGATVSLPVGSHTLNWHERFKDGKGRREFDVVIGNPPYIRAENMNKDDREYWQASGQYSVIYGRFDIFILFMERGLDLLRDKGRLGFIVPSALLNQNYATLLRRKILDSTVIESIVDCSNYKVFEQANVATIVTVLQKELDREVREHNMLTVVAQDDYERGIAPEPREQYPLSQSLFRDTPNHMFRLGLIGPVKDLVDKVGASGLIIGDICVVITGVVAHDSKTGASKDRLITETAISKVSKPYVEAKELLGERYAPLTPKRYIEYIPEAMHRPKFPELFESPKILIQRIIGSSRIVATFDENSIYTNHSFICCVQKHHLTNTDQRLPINEIDVAVAQEYDPRYLLGLLNSTLISAYFQIALGGKMDIYPEQIRQLPIYKIDFSDQAQIRLHDRVVKHVEMLLELHRQRAEATPNTYAADEIERAIAREDAALDELVCKELYGLTDEEIVIVKGM